jgi:hypothetical protein
MAARRARSKRVFVALFSGRVGKESGRTRAVAVKVNTDTGTGVEVCGVMSEEGMEVCEDVARVVHIRRDNITDVRKTPERTGYAWALLVIQVVVGEEVEAGDERDNGKTLLFGVQHIPGGLVGNKEVEGVVLLGGLRGHVCERMGNGSVFERIKTEESTRATGRVSNGSCVAIQQRRDHAMLVNPKPRASSNEILSAVYPGGVPQAQWRSGGAIQGFVAIGRSNDGIARKHLKIEGEGAHSGGGL